MEITRRKIEHGKTFMKAHAASLSDAKKHLQLNDKATIARVKRKANLAIYAFSRLIQLANNLKIDPLTISGSFAVALVPA
jgi:hypothetical protein